MIRYYLGLVERMDPLFSQGLTLMMYGMATVVLFLLLLVVAMRMLAWFVSLTPPKSDRSVFIQAPMSSTDSDEVTIAVISAAVTRYRDGA